MTSGATLIQLRAFIAAADAGSFGRAAKALGLSPSSVSEGVLALEQLHGQTLFRRSPRGIVLTRAGERALPHARLTAQHSEDFALAMNERAALAGSLTVATNRSLGVHLLPPVLSLLRRRHPDLSVQILDGSSGEGGEQLVQDGRADVAFLELAARTTLFTVPVVEDDYVLVLPRAKHTPPLAWTDLQTQPLLLFPAQQSCNAEIHRHLDTFLPAGTVVQEIAEDEVMLSMVEHGLGLAVLPRLAVLPLRESRWPWPCLCHCPWCWVSRSNRAGRGCRIFAPSPKRSGPIRRPPPSGTFRHCSGQKPFRRPLPFRSAEVLSAEGVLISWLRERPKTNLAIVACQGDPSPEPGAGPR